MDTTAIEAQIVRSLTLEFGSPDSYRVHDTAEADDAALNEIYALMDPVLDGWEDALVGMGLERYQAQVVTDRVSNAWSVS